MEQLKIEAEMIRARMCIESSLVWGEGDLDARLMLVGEAPGAQEDLLGRPFVGVSGRLLDDELTTLGIARESVYITGAVKCRPTSTASGRVSNRTPTKEEVDAWREVLLRQIEIISPRVILCLGSTAASVLIHARFQLVAERGKWFEGPLGTRAMATFHPAYIHRFRRDPESPDRRLFRADLRAAAEGAARP